MTEPLPEDLSADLIAGAAMGDLDDEESASFARMLAENPHLQTEVDRCEVALSNLSHLVLAAPPPHLRTQILQAAHAPALTARRISKSAFVTGISVLLALGSAIYSYFLRQELMALEAQIVYQKDTIAMLQQSNTSLVSLRGMQMAPTASGNIVITPGEQKAVLVVRNLPILPPGQSYYLWAAIDGREIPCGRIVPNAQGRVLTKLPIPAAKIETAVITIEPTDSPSAPRGPQVMTSGV